MIQINSYLLRASTEAIKIAQDKKKAICDILEELHPGKPALQMAILERCESIIGTKLTKKERRCKQ